MNENDSDRNFGGNENGVEKDSRIVTSNPETKGTELVPGIQRSAKKKNKRAGSGDSPKIDTGNVPVQYAKDSEKLRGITYGDMEKSIQQFNGYGMEQVITKQVISGDFSRLGQKLYTLAPKAFTGLHSQMDLCIKMLRLKYLDKFDDEKLLKHLSMIGIVSFKQREYLERMTLMESYLYGIILERMQTEIHKG